MRIPGGRLHYEVRGAGPVLLLIPGAPADATMYAGITGLLADRYTIVSYDPRGISRSNLDGPAEEQRIEVHADDAHRLLATTGTQPGYVLGCGAGALVGLELATGHPEQVRTLVAHEPPALALLPDNSRWWALFQEVYELYRSAGAGPAMQKLDEGLGLGGSPQPPDPNMEFWLAHMMRPIGQYVPDIATLRTASPRIVMAGGETAAGQPAHRAAVELAERLGTTLTTFPGGHAGFATHFAAFAEKLHKVLRPDGADVGRGVR